MIALFINNVHYRFIKRYTDKKKSFESTISPKITLSITSNICAHFLLLFFSSSFDIYFPKVYQLLNVNSFSFKNFNVAMLHRFH